jgi:hypothetical protein
MEHLTCTRATPSSLAAHTQSMSNLATPNRTRGFAGRLRALPLLVGMAVSLGSASAAHAGWVTGVSLTVDPANHVGSCGTERVTFTFTGSIRTDGPATVQYRFLRSDGVRGPVGTLQTQGAGFHHVSTTWTMGTAVGSFQGWQTLEVLYPNTMISGRAAFRLECGSEPGMSWLTRYRYQDGDGPGECLLSGSGQDAGHLEPGELIQVEIHQKGATFKGSGVLYEADGSGRSRITFLVVGPRETRYQFDVTVHG